VWLAPIPVLTVLLAAHYLGGGAFIQALLMATAEGVAAAAVVLGIRRYGGVAPRGWWLTFGGLALMGAGTLASDGLSALGAVVTSPSLADALFLGGYLAILLGVRSVLSATGRPLPRASLLDVGIIAIGAGLIAWLAAIDPLIDSGRLGTLAFATSAAYPVFDVLWLGLVARLLFRPGTRTPAFWLIVAAIVAVLVSDTALAWVESVGGTRTGPVIDLGWWVAIAALAVAALHPTMVDLLPAEADAVDQPSSFRIANLLLASLVTPVVLVVQGWSNPNDLDLWVVVGGSAALSMLVAARLAIIAGDLKASLAAEHATQLRLVQQARQDALTSLPNRTAFGERLASVLKMGEPAAVLVCDLDDFGQVNGTLGTEIGDAVLIAVGERLTGQLRVGDTVARLDGDEFGLLIRGVSDLQTARHLAEQVVSAVAAPLTVGARELVVRASIGVALSGPARTDADAILRDADIALYLAKSGGKGRAEVFSDELHAELAARLVLRGELEAAIADHGFVLHYQPVVELQTGAIEGVEALVRWKHRSRGLLPPSEFIALAEGSGLIVPLGRWILGEALREAASWGPAGEHLSVAVNVSPPQLREAAFMDDLRAALRSSKLDPARLVIEITESVFAEALITAEVLKDIRALGVRVAIDDFGTGYSSLAYVQQYPVDIIKIDRSFVINLTDPKSAAVTTTIVELAKKLRITTIAEGIEQPDQLANLVAFGCDLGQGYLFAKPMEAKRMRALVLNGVHGSAHKASPALELATVGAR
jgi:diguanylate cyclase (GGDEF) domain